LFQVWNKNLTADKDERVKRNIVNMLKSKGKSPNSYEKKFIDLCKKYELQYKYVGNGKRTVGGYCPDFININGKKILVETYSTFWHVSDYEESRGKLFTGYGYKTLFLDDDALNRDNWEEYCLSKVLEIEEENV